MTMIDQLINRSGRVRELLGVSNDGRILDLSRAGWECRFDVVRGVTFDRIRLCDTQVSTDFVECTFEESEFSRLRSKSHFSGAANTWVRCVFKDLVLVDVIAPQSRFVDCEFRNVSVHGLRLCQTLFDNCRFMDCVIGGISARRAGDKSLQLPEIVRAGATALFCRCHFDRGSFAGCAFADVGFEKCEVRHTQFINCDFRNVVGPDRWWTQVESGDPFNSFLDTVLNGIEERLGRDSSAFLSLSGFAKEYRLGRTQDKDYSACLYTGDVPEEELDAIQEILDQAESAFPM